MIKKASAQHLEIIFAFILFSSFVFFLLYFLPLPKGTQLIDSSLTSLQNLFENQSQEELTQISIKTNSNSCFSIVNSLSSNFGGIVKDENNNIINSGINSDLIVINSEKQFFKIYLSPSIPSSSIINCPELLPEDYIIGGIKKTKVISNLTITNFIKEYKENYETTKENLKVPMNLDFAIKIEDIKDFSNVPINSEVKAISQSYIILLPNGELENKEITFQLWS